MTGRAASLGRHSSCVNAPAERLCKRCARPFAAHHRHKSKGDERVYCSAECRRHKLSNVDAALESAVLELLAERGPGKSICPSEAARRIDKENFRPLMKRTRYAVNRLAASGKVEVTQAGRVVDAPMAKGAIRVRTANQRSIEPPSSRGSHRR